MRELALGVLVATCAMHPAAAAAPVVATDIAPVNSIVARVMEGVGTPGLVVPAGGSPHAYALRPSEARLLADAELVVWVGPALTPWLAGPLAALAPDASLVTLQDAPGVVTLPVRDGGGVEAHGHAAGDDHGHGDAGGIDGHLWLDPENAVAAAEAVAAALAAVDPEHSTAYLANAGAFASEVREQERRIDARLAPLRDRPFLVFHDAYQYFERRFGLTAAASVVLQDGVEPGVARVARIREQAQEDGIVCAFSEPAFEPKLLATVIEGSGVRTGVLDGLGASLPPGPGLYPALLEGVADSLEACLAD
jgi:zinc transport system substrate-binding protein